MKKLNILTTPNSKLLEICKPYTEINAEDIKLSKRDPFNRRISDSLKYDKSISEIVRNIKTKS